MTRVDLHLHLLPGLDDGAPDEASALDHAARMVAAGVTVATVTPHVGAPDFDVDPLAVPDRTAALAEALRREGIPLALRPGGEVHASALQDLRPGALAAVAQGPPGRRWILAEVPFEGLDDGFVDGLCGLRGRGYGAVVAHPERAAGLFAPASFRRLRAALDGGAVLQVNVCSLLGRHGEEVRAAARRLVRTGLAHVLASDGHPGHRDHTLADGEPAAAAAGASRAQVLELTQARPAALLCDGVRGAAEDDRGARARRARSVALVRSEARRLVAAPRAR